MKCNHHHRPLEPNVMIIMMMMMMVMMVMSPSLVEAEPRVVNLVRDVIREKHWDYLSFVTTQDNELMTTVETQKTFASLVGSMSASLVFLRKAQNATGGNSSSSNPPISSISLRDPDAELKIHHRNAKYRTQFLVLWDPAGHVASYMMKASKYGLYTDQQEWLIILPKNTTMKDFYDKLTSAKIYVDSEVTVCSYQGDGQSFLLRMVWRPGKGMAMRQETVGNWSEDQGLQLMPLEHKYDRRKDLKGFHLRVATIISMPYVSIKENATKQNFDTGYVVDVWHTFQEQMNFTYTAKDTLFGSLQKDGVSWNGMVGMLQTDDSDAAVAPLSITNIRAVAIDFTLPIQIVSTRLYIRRPVLESTWTLYTQPFGKLMWICTPISVLVLAISLWLYNRISNITEINSHEISFSQSFLMMLMSLFQQSAEVEPKMVSGKIVFFAGFWNGMILYNCYSGILVSILTTRQPQLPFRDFEGLLQRPDWDLGVRTNTALADSLALAPKNHPMRISWDKHVVRDPIKNLPNNNDDALVSVLQGKYAFFANKEYIIYRIQSALPLSEAMNIVDTKTDFLQRGIGFGLQKGSPFKKLFNHVLTKMTQKGHLDRLKKKWWPNLNREPDPSYPSPGFKEVFTLFILWGFGMLIAVILCIAERVIHTYDNKRKLEADLDVYGYSEKKLAF